MARWKPGQSGNPGGRPKRYGDIRDLAQQYTAAAVQTLVHVLNDPVAPPSARVTAAQALLDRGWGRPIQQIDARVSRGYADMLRELDCTPAALLLSLQDGVTASDQDVITAVTENSSISTIG